jgi:hypothetical protein
LLDASGSRRVQRSWNALEPRGRVDLLCGLQWPQRSRWPIARAAMSPRVSLDLDLAGRRASPSTAGRAARQQLEGFPLAVDQLTAA